MSPQSAPPARIKPPRVALTGGIASGKSTVALLFAALGVPVIDADQIAREVVAPGTPLLSEVFARFGAQLRRSDGSLDRAALRRLVFADAGQRLQLEALLHPAIARRTELLSAAAGGPYQIHVIPLLVETAAGSHYDRVLLVDCPEELQVARLQARDGCDGREARAMLASQASRQARLAAADDVILNDAAPSALTPKVAALHQHYLALAALARSPDAPGEPPAGR
jgi:dephospho-CoA kinase